MSEEADNDKLDKGLWRRYAARGAGEGPAPDANALAAYLDGSAEPEVAEQVEAAMARDPDLLEEVMELRALTGAEAAVPESVLRAAKALWPAEQTGASVIPARGWWRRLQWAAAAAAVAAACAGGYVSGQGTGREQRQAFADTAARTALAFEELISEPDLEMPGQVNGGNGGAS